MSREPSTTYAERLAYSRWVRALTVGEAEESDQDLIRRSGVKQSWFSKWKDSQTPPPRHIELAPLADALGVSMEFLLGRGLPPLPALWRDWIGARRGRGVTDADRRYGLPDAKQPAEVGGLEDLVARAVPLSETAQQRAMELTDEKAARKATESAPRGRRRKNGGSGPASA